MPELMKFTNENAEIYTPIPQCYNVVVEMVRDQLLGDWHLIRTNVDIDAKPSDLKRIKNKWEDGEVGELPSRSGKKVFTSKRKVSCETEGRYQFSLARKHLQEALNGSDNIMYVGEGVVLFEKKDYKHMVPTCTNGKQGLECLVKH